jgi:hypothetical protein
MTATQTSTTPSDTGNIDLMGWDTVFALSLDALNNSIVVQKTSPASFSGTDPVGGASVSGNWGAWSVIGGEGGGIYMKCPVITGTMTVPGMPQAKLDGSTVVVLITLAQGDSSRQLADSTAKEGSGKTKVFQANSSSSDPFQQPKVQTPSSPPSPTSSSFPGVSGYAVYGAVAAFQAYFNANLGAFNAVFAAVRLEEEAIEANKQWLKPQVSLYAMASSGDDSRQDTYFGLLSLTSPLQSGQKLPQQNFDERMFSFFTKTTPPTNSVFAISAPLAMQNIVLQSAQHCVKNATLDDFEIINSGVTVTNKKELDWGDFHFDKDKPDQIVTPKIAPGNFQLSLDGSNFHLAISQAAFTTPDGTCDVKLSADQFFNFGATKLKNGKYYFTPDPGLGTNSIRADVTANKDFQIAMIIESIVVSVAFAFIGAGIGEALGEAASSTVSSATEGAIDAGEDAIGDAIDSMSEDEVSDLTDESLSDATDSIANEGENTQGKSGIFANKFKIWGGVLGGMFGIPVGLLPQIMTAIYNDQITEGNVPTVDEFATNFTAAVQWPQVTGWQVTGGTFASAFMLGGNASS